MARAVQELRDFPFLSALNSPGRPPLTGARNVPLTTYATLIIAIALEVVGTTFLQRSAQFTRLAPTLLMGICYAGSFFFLSLTLRTMPLGIAYAIWSALGIVLVSIIGLVVFGQRLDLPAMLGLAMIIGGVVVVNVFSKSVVH
ncbi:multidrug efflux SMR transporter [Paracoccus sp. MBLB3053]|uniref:Multidrug efflux SMR transporter n=1 Tax=Paracoccus aurantius TaxID=3073814 RepID=A0ABU2HTJ2_9RHOB|nr:multidrug efflux SMR transporter [Paracoccus sp. MBLB3053]MDS9468368.1 multidrug efflux SMR transporter [Paracoccus sp. MBLB3053]